jgi:hypothetical protein
MKSRPSIIIALLLIFFLPIDSYSESGKSKYISDCEIILSDLHDLINDKDIKKNEHVFNAIDLCFNKFKEKKLGVHIDDSLPKDIFGGMQFEFNIDNKINPTILISPYMITLYKTRPSVVFSALAHEMQHAKSYFDNTDFFISMRKSDLERYLYELDSYNIEANFIKTYLINKKFTLTSFESILIKSYEEDYLDTFSFGLLGHDMKFAFYLIDIEKKQISYQEKIKLINQCLSDLETAEFKNEGSDWDKYRQIVTLYSALKFSPQTIRNIEVKHNKIITTTEYHMKNQNPELYNILLNIEKKFTSISKYYYEFLSDRHNQFKKV